MEIQQDREGLSFLFQTNISFYFFRSTLGSDLNKTSWNITLQREIEDRSEDESRLAICLKGAYMQGIYPVIDAACALSCRRRDSSGRESAGREANVLETEAILAYPRPIVAHVAGKGAVANRAVAMTLSLFH